MTNLNQELEPTHSCCCYYNLVFSVGFLSLWITFSLCIVSKERRVFLQTGVFWVQLLLLNGTRLLQKPLERLSGPQRFCVKNANDETWLCGLRL